MRVGLASCAAMSYLPLDGQFVRSLAARHGAWRHSDPWLRRRQPRSASRTSLRRRPALDRRSTDSLMGGLLSSAASSSGAADRARVQARCRVRRVVGLAEHVALSSPRARSQPSTFASARSLASERSGLRYTLVVMSSSVRAVSDRAVLIRSGLFRASVAALPNLDVGAATPSVRRLATNARPCAITNQYRSVTTLVSWCACGLEFG
jgi:hypothetical protein